MEHMTEEHVTWCVVIDGVDKSINGTWTRVYGPYDHQDAQQVRDRLAGAYSNARIALRHLFADPQEHIDKESKV